MSGQDDSTANGMTREEMIEKIHVVQKQLKTGKEEIKAEKQSLSKKKRVLETLDKNLEVAQMEVEMDKELQTID